MLREVPFTIQFTSHTKDLSFLKNVTLEIFRRLLGHLLILMVLKIGNPLGTFTELNVYFDFYLCLARINLKLAGTPILSWLFFGWWVNVSVSSRS
jgi:hypothetical protein